MRWPGFRRVRNQVCKRVQRHLEELSCVDASQYRDYLDAHPEEWPVLDALCRVTVTRFYRDKQVFAMLMDEVLPALARAALERHAERLHVWCVGCASGEEPYTIAIAWQLELAERFPDLAMVILATDADAGLLERAAQACYGWSAVRNLPAAWREAAFVAQEDSFCLKSAFKTAVHFQQQDVRRSLPQGCYDLICCRNLAFTYFEPALQIHVAGALYERLLQGGVLLLGVREKLPDAGLRFRAISERLALYRRS
jgi:chemotaxis protein methyltransferase CheR